MRKIDFLRCALWGLLCAQLFCFERAHGQSTYAYAGNSNKPLTHLKIADDKDTENRQKQKLLVVLKELNETKGVYFLFAEQSLADKLVNPADGTDGSIERILDKVLKNSGLQFKKINDKTFVILSSTNLKTSYDVKPVNFQPGGPLLAENSVHIEMSADIITGTVIGADGRPLAGVSVTIKGSRKGTSTNTDGVFTLPAKKGDVLVFSSIGLINQELVVGDKSNLSITMVEDKKALNEVVVTALGLKKQKRELGYSTTEIDGSKLTQSREVNLGNALTGQVAGVSVAGVSTGPYGSSRVIIRGNSSLNGNNQPLYIIDGIPFDNSNQGSTSEWGGADYGDGLSNINPDDVESIQVLKGVAATALYGYRGGNGAILVTTKSGTKNRGIGVEVNDNITANMVHDFRDYQYTYGQGTLGVEPLSQSAANATAESNWGQKIGDGSTAINFLGDPYKYVANKDQYKDFYKTGVTNQSSVAMYGSNDKGHFRLGVSDLYLNTNVPNSNMKQQGLNFNTTYNITPKLQMVLTANYIFETVKNRASFSDAPGNFVASTIFISNTFNLNWLKPRVDANRNELLPGSADIYFENPYFIAYDFQNATSRNRLTGGLTLKYNILDWLFVQGQVTRDGYTFDQQNITPNGVQYTNSGGGSINMSEINQHELDGNFMIGANKKFGPDFSLNANAGVYSQENLWNQYSGGGGPFVIPYFYSVSNVASKPFNYGYSESRVNSVYGSAELGYKNYLFLTGTLRNDWFSVLNPKTNNYLYPSLSASFVFSDAFRMPSWISFGKFRAAAAASSNNGAAGAYSNALTYGLQGYTINGQSIGYVNNISIPNQFLKPVNVKEKELGLNMEFLNNRIGFDLAVYDKTTTNDIVPVSVSGTSGYGTNIINIGQLRNKGIEILITATPVRIKDFTWNLSFNFAYNNSKVLSLATSGIPLVLDVPRNGDANISNIVGLPYGQIMGYKYLRDTKNNIVYDTSGLPLRTSALEPLGTGVYNKTGGITNDFHYKNFSLTVLIDFKYGAKIFSGSNLILYSDGLSKTTLQGRESGIVGKGVTQDGHPNTVNVPAETYWNEIAYGQNNVPEEFTYDASFIKLRSLSLAYSLPAKVLKNGFIKGLTFSLVGRNLAILMKHTPNIDPESTYTNSNAQGLELSGYPSVRSIGCNVNVKF